MKKKPLFRSLLVLAMIAGSYFVIHSNSTTSIETKKICNESMEECCKEEKRKTNPSGEMIWENISRQFIFTSAEIFR